MRPVNKHRLISYVINLRPSDIKLPDGFCGGNLSWTNASHMMRKAAFVATQSFLVFISMVILLVLCLIEVAFVGPFVFLMGAVASVMNFILNASYDLVGVSAIIIVDSWAL